MNPDLSDRLVPRLQLGHRLWKTRSIAIICAALILAPDPAAAFFELTTEGGDLEVTGNLRVNQLVGRNPEAFGIEDRTLEVTNAVFRTMGLAAIADAWTFEVHAVQSFIGGASIVPTSGVADGFSASTFNRWSGLSWRWYDRSPTQAELSIDRLNAAWARGRAQVKIGRQPVNFATTYYFTPNDLLQPFAAQAFFRLFKPGVDAARVELGLGDFTDITVVGVLGYRRNADRARVSDAVTWNESAVLLRARTTAGPLELSLLGGKAPRQYVVGGAVQGELFEWLGVRAEGHYARGTVAGPRRDRARLSAGLEHRFESSLFLRAEYFYNGGGARQANDYLSVLADPLFPVGAPYLGRHYAAAGAGYELHPLLNLETLALVNFGDSSGQVAAYLTFSMLDDVDLAAVASLPFGARPRSTLRPEDAIRSEFGSYPAAASLEFRAFF